MQCLTEGKVLPHAKCDLVPMWTLCRVCSYAVCGPMHMQCSHTANQEQHTCDDPWTKLKYSKQYQYWYFFKSWQKISREKTEMYQASVRGGGDLTIRIFLGFLNNDVPIFFFLHVFLAFWKVTEYIFLLLPLALCMSLNCILWYNIDMSKRV